MAKLWVDDLRPPPGAEWVWVKTSTQALEVLKFGLDYQEVSLDHDLGGDDTTRPIVLWMAENNCWPDIIGCHSANPPGREWIEGMIARYKEDA